MTGADRSPISSASRLEDDRPPDGSAPPASPGWHVDVPLIGPVG